MRSLADEAIASASIEPVAYSSLPVSAQVRAASEVGRGGDVGPGEAAQFLDKSDTCLVRGHVAAVKQDVGVGGQRVGPGAQLRLVALEARGVEGCGAEGEAAARAVGDDMQRADAAGTRGEGLAICSRPSRFWSRTSTSAPENRPAWSPSAPSTTTSDPAAAGSADSRSRLSRDSKAKRWRGRRRRGMVGGLARENASDAACNDAAP